MKQIDYINKRIGNLTVIDELEPHITPNGSKQRIVKCKCDCGNVFIINLSSAKKSGKCRDCLAKDRRIDITGKRFGKLLVVGMAEDYISPSGHRLSMCNCLCDCGNATTVHMSSLTSGKTTSCGCVQNTRGLLKDNPELMNKYDFQKNEEAGIRIDNLTARSSKKVWWKCDTCGRSWIATIASQNDSIKHGCPYCSGRFAIPGETDLFTQYPEIVKEWDYEKNTIDPSEISSKSNSKVWWKCSVCGHEWKATIGNRTYNKSGCPRCNIENVNSFCEQAVFFYIKKAFVDAVNSDLHTGMELDIYIPSINVAIEYDGEAWHSNSRRIENDNKKNEMCHSQGIDLIRIREPKLPDIDGCTVFKRKDSISDKTLNSVIEDVLRYLKVDDISVDVEADSGKILAQFATKKYQNSLAYCNPEVAEEWHPAKNGDLTPDQISKASRRKVWWLGKCGHEWQAIVGERTIKPTKKQNGRTKKPYGCPYCSGRRVGQGINDLQTINPGLALEWHPTKNGDLKPTMVTANSSIRAWWKCEKGHEWQSPVQHRNGRGSECPQCRKEKRSPKVRCIETDEIFINAKDACLKKGIRYSSSIYKCCRGEQEKCAGYHWEYADE